METLVLHNCAVNYMDEYIPNKPRGWICDCDIIHREPDTYCEKCFKFPAWAKTDSIGIGYINKSWKVVNDLGHRLYKVKCVFCGKEKIITKITVTAINRKSCTHKK